MMEVLASLGLGVAVAAIIGSVGGLEEPSMEEEGELEGRIQA
jgi:hypothetical protein